MVPFKRTCPRCRETAEWVGLTEERSVALRVNLVPMGTYHSPSRLAIYACSTCGCSFKLLPRVGHIFCVVFAVLGLPFFAFAWWSTHMYDGENGVALGLLLGLAIEGGSLGPLLRDVLLRRRSPIRA